MRHLVRALTAGLLLALTSLAAPLAAGAAAGAGSVAGVVVDHAGRPVGGVTVTVLADATSPASGPVTTGPDGSFTIAPVAAGARIVEVAGASPGVGLPYSTTLWTARMAFPMVVVDGGPTDVRLAVGQGTVRGTISVNGGPPPLTARIEAVNQYGDTFSSFLGIAPYAMPLPVGIWDLTVSGTAPGFSTTPVTVNGLVVAAGKSTNLDVSLPGTTYSGPSWVGLVTDPDGAPVPDVQIEGTAHGVTGPDGRYGLELDPQQVTINFDADFIPPAATGLAIVHAGSAPLGLRPYVVDVVLPRAGVISGFVTDPSGAPLAQATVTVQATGNGPARTVTTGPAGTFRIDQLVPGQRTLVVSLVGQTPTTQLVTVAPGETTVVNPIVQPTDYPPPVIPEGPASLLFPVLAAAVFGAGMLRHHLTTRSSQQSG